MEMKISSVLAGWNNKVKWSFRRAEAGLRCLESVVKDNLDSDVLLFPGGFITQEDDRDYWRSKIKEAVSGYRGMLIIGFDGGEYASPLVVYGGKDYAFNQAYTKRGDVCNEEYARMKRLFEHKGLIVGVVSCGELLSRRFAEIMFKDGKPDILFGCVHSGVGLSGIGSFPNEFYREKLNRFSKIASFYTFHMNDIWKGIPRNKNFSGVSMDEDEMKIDGTLWLSVMKYKMDTGQTYKIPVTMERLRSSE